MRRLILVRHGESEANLSHTFANRGDGPELTALGRAQAGQLAAQIRDAGITEIYSSPLARSMQTADAIARRLGLAVTASESLREYDVGELEGQANAMAWQRYADMERRWLLDRDWSARHPGGESYSDMVHRFGLFWRAVRPGTAGTALAVTHGGLMRMVLPHFAVGLGHADAYRTRVPNCAIVVVQPDGRLTCGAA